MSNTHVVIASTVAGCVTLYGLLWSYFWRSNRGARNLYFDAQDFAKYENGGGRDLPVSAVTGTFAPFLQHYIGVTKVLITLAAASITFGGNPNKNTVILAAKLILAFSILYGVLFCAFMLYAYDEYCQNVRAYTRFWYSTVEAFGFSTLLSFIVGYLFWASNLG
jgi:hypothetical protein